MPSVLITGTSKGIGLESALAFGRAGHKVHATMRKPSHSPELAEAAARENLPITISTMDVDSDQSVSDGIAQIMKDHGPIDVLVNNAGVERMGSVEELPLSDFRAVMETNYFGALRSIQALAAPMRQRRSGCIINVSSVAGRVANAPMAPYTASKWALEALSEALAGVRGLCSAICSTLRFPILMISAVCSSASSSSGVSPRRAIAAVTSPSTSCGPRPARAANG